MIEHQRFRVPEWYATLSLKGQPGAREGARQIGPLTVFNAGQGAEVATFGEAASPGVVIFDGYLFDRSRLLSELALAGSSSNAALCAAAFERWGDGVFDRLDGSYLLAIWDARQRRLLLGHDALGHHPLFFCAADGLVAFSSNVLTLARSGVVPRQPNRQSLAFNALMLWPDADETFFERIHRLGAGRFMTVNADGAMQEHEFYTPWLREGDDELSEQEVHDTFEAALTDAVGRCLELEPDGIMLSGGLDSVTIAALATELTSRAGRSPVTAVSGRADRLLLGEDPFQDKTVEALGMRHLVSYEDEWQGGRDVVELSRGVIAELPGPSRIYWVGGYMAFYRQTAERGVTSLLTGSGGDNWVSVATTYTANLLRGLRARELREFLDSYLGTGGVSPRRAAELFLWSGGLRVLLDAWGARLVPQLNAGYHRHRAQNAMPAWLCPDPLLKAPFVEARLAQLPAPLTPGGRVPDNFYRHIQRAIPNPYFVYEFETGFHIESACGLRLLSPYHDRTLVKLLNAVAPRVLLKGGTYKGLLRNIAERRLPGIGLREQRKVYAPGIQQTSERTLCEAVSKAWPTTSLPALADCGVIDVKKAKEALNPANPSHAVTMCAIMSAEWWLDAHFA